MVMKAEPILRAVEEIQADYAQAGEQIRLLFPSPHGRPFTQAYAKNLAADPRRLVILCGHYEGVDERVRLALHPEEISVGDYVLTGGELPALVLIDAAARLVPGVLGDPESIVEESFTDGVARISALYETCGSSRDARAGGVAFRTSRGHSSVASEGSPAKHLSETAGSFARSGLESRRSTIARRTYS